MVEDLVHNIFKELVKEAEFRMKKRAFFLQRGSLFQKKKRKRRKDN